MIHKGLEDYVAEGGLTAKCRSGIAHPHNRAGNGESDDNVLDLLKFLVELSKLRHNAHQRADMEGKLINGDSVVAVRERHKEEIRNVEAYDEIGKHTEKLCLCLFGFVLEFICQKCAAAQYYEKVHKMPYVKQPDSKL